MNLYYNKINYKKIEYFKRKIKILLFKILFFCKKKKVEKF
jgi:hypothetical protein